MIINRAIFTLIVTICAFFYIPAYAAGPHEVQWRLDDTSGDPAILQFRGLGGNWITTGTGSIAGTFSVVGTLPLFTQTGTGAVGRTFIAREKDWVSAKDFLTVGQPDGSTDNSTQVQAAITAMCNTGGGTLWFPASNAKYVVHDVTIPCTMKVKGDGRTSTLIGFAGSATFGLRFQVPSFPAFKSGDHIRGASIEDVTLNYATTTTDIVQVKGVRDFHMSHVTAQNFSAGYGQINNFLYSIGNENMDIQDVRLMGVNGLGFYFFGDLTGQTASGAACTTGNADCSTRSDFITMRDILVLNGNGSSGTGIRVRGFVATIMGEHFANENMSIGLDVSCQAGLAADLSQCPHFLFLDDFQAEFFTAYGILASDFRSLKMNKPYLYGDGSVTNQQDMSVGALNYPASSTPVGDVVLSDGFLFSTRKECFLVSNGGVLRDIKISGTAIYGCNIANSGFAAANLQGTTTQVTLTDNKFCTLGGFAGATPPVYGVAIGTNTTNAIVSNNSFYGCGARILNSSSSPFSVVDTGNQGPGGNPSIGTCGGGSPVVAGNDRSMLVTVGTGTPASCSINFGSAQSLQPICIALAVPGATAVSSTSTSTAAVAIQGSALNGQYSVLCGVP